MEVYVYRPRKRMTSPLVAGHLCVRVGNQTIQPIYWNHLIGAWVAAETDLVLLPPDVGANVLYALDRYADNLVPLAYDDVPLSGLLRAGKRMEERFNHLRDEAVRRYGIDLTFTDLLQITAAFHTLAQDEELKRTDIDVIWRAARLLAKEHSKVFC